MSTKERGQWSSWLEFALSCIGSMVGLGNVWRFPYICFKNGGGAFLIPYMLFIMIMAIPLQYMEFSLAQFSNFGPTKIWNCCPLFKGLGYCMISLTIMTSPYYSTVVSWTLFYFGNSFFSPLPWTKCDSWWNTEACQEKSLSEEYQHISNKSADNVSYVTNDTHFATPAVEFWENRVLGLTRSINDIGHLQFHLVLCSLATWSVAMFALVKGIKSSGKFMLLASTLPYVMLTVLLVRGLLLPGAMDGIKYFFIPRWEDLLKFSVWSDAATQVFFSTSLGVGELLTLASHNEFSNNCQRDAIILPFVDGITSLFAGCVIFSTLGYIAHISKININAVVNQGPGIAFVVYPDPLATLPLPQLWSGLFFLLLFTVGVSGMVVAVQVVSVAIFDSFPGIPEAKRRLITALICICGFLFSLLYTSGGGMYVLQLMDWYLGSIPRAFSVTLESIVLLHIYGVSRINENVEMMLGHKPPKALRFLWLFVTPPLMAFMWIFMVFQYTPVKYGTDPYPSWSIVVGWIVGLLPIMLVFIGMVRPLLLEKGTIFQRIKRSVQIDSSWSPVVQDTNELVNIQ